MSSPIARVLQILLLLQKAQPAQPVMEVMKSWGVNSEDKAQVARIRAFVIDEIRQAALQIKAGAVEGEETDLLPAIEALESLFAGDLFNSSISNYPALGPTISAFRVIVRVGNLAPPERPRAIGELIQLIEEMIGEFQASQLDSLIKETALQHLRALAILLKYVEAFGIEAAQIEYTALLLRLRNAQHARPADVEKARPLVDRIKSWLGLLKEADEAYESGQKLIERVGDIVGLIS